MTTTITSQLITARITSYLWRVERNGELVASGSTNDLELAQEESGQYA